MAEWLTAEDVARELKFFTGAGEPNVVLVQRMARRGELPGQRIASRWRFRRDHIDAWSERRANPDVWQRTPHAEAARRRRAS